MYKLPTSPLQKYNSFQGVKHKLLGMVDIDEDKIYDLIVQVENDRCMKWNIIFHFPFWALPLVPMLKEKNAIYFIVY